MSENNENEFISPEDLRKLNKLWNAPERPGADADANHFFPSWLSWTSSEELQKAKEPEQPATKPDIDFLASIEQAAAEAWTATETLQEKLIKALDAHYKAAYSFRRFMSAAKYRVAGQEFYLTFELAMQVCMCGRPGCNGTTMVIGSIVVPQGDGFVVLKGEYVDPKNKEENSEQQ